MNQYYKGKAKYTLAWLAAFIFVLVTLCSRAFDTNHFRFHISLTTDTKFAVTTDTIPVKNKKDSISSTADSTLDLLKATPGVKEIKPTGKGDTSLIPTVDSFAFKSSGDSLDAPVSYHADDSMLMDIPAKKLYLYGKSSDVTYKSSDLSAPVIEFDQQSSIVSAFLVKDSNGKVIAYPAYNDKDFRSVSDTLRFNMKTGKGLTKGTYTQQGEMYVYGEKIKKVDENVFYALHGRFTTCNLDTPHFAFVSSKIKFINKKMAFSGPVHPEFEGVPLPIVLPFGIYPLTQGRHSGFIAPSFAANEQYGLSLEGLGYYKILGPVWDVVLRGTLYSYGGWQANISPRYYKRYRYQGNFNLHMLRSKIGFKGDPDYSVTKGINVQWTHSADTKARPGVTFQASVNAGSTKFNQNVPNNPQINYTNLLQSTISYGKVWKNKPYNVQVTAGHDQNSTSGLINVSLPNVAFNVTTLYPFRRKEAIGSYKWYENLGVALNTNVRSLSSFYDSANAWPQIAKNYKWGASHSVPITLSLPSLGPLQVSPSVSYQERWYHEKFYLAWNAADKKLDTTIKKGFYTARDMNYGVSMTTRIFGSYLFGKRSKVQAIRHEIRPVVSVNYKPDFNSQNYYDVQTDTSGKYIAQHSYYERSVYGSFSRGKFAGLNFGIDNNIQMKVKNRKDTAQDAVKKVTLIDGLGINGSYNFLADSFKLSSLTVSARSNLFQKVNITANASFDPYRYDATGRRIDKLIWTKKAVTLGTLSSASISLSSRFQGGDKKNVGPGTAAANRTMVDPNNIPGGLTLDEYQQEAMYMQNNPGEFADFAIPWSVDFSYSLRYNQSRTLASSTAPSKIVKTLNQDINFNNSINLTPKWKLGIQGSYNITQKELGVLTMFVSRDLHCWQMTINLAPVGRYRFFTINISPKSAILRDIKVNRTRYFYDL
ncbi:MAG: LPS-assembly protein LptD [Bacteroidetes bacterium]|nr:LPS-assembly protein LptD [Bacteroidota bacterium]